MIKLEQYDALGRFILSSQNTPAELRDADTIVDVAPFVFVFDP